ncbi:MAG: PEP-CTERM/exosortase system-associated acyltransferase [Chromatiaceae bacterium]|nr:PEP-CTERM/exosortase system-associated acyltransferase [Gammaproteobacteria bacterium]MCP5448640.1 PEP-CTERM/exosortase system-associated acyltransferase [Chromatiaceae bacterium]
MSSATQGTSDNAEGQNLTLAENFQKYFAVEFVTSSRQRSDVYRIRYRVYCDEFEYEPAHLFPDGEEHDEFDGHSLHCLIRHRASQMPAGCVRLVPAVGNASEELLPFEKHCKKSLDEAYISGLNLDRRTICEISRLAVDGAFRRRSGEALTRFGEIDALDCSQQEKRTFSLIAVAGFLAATALTDLTGRNNVFAMMEPFLPRLMQRSGIVFQRAGRDINYHGIRAPYFITTQLALGSMKPELNELYRIVRNQIELTYR